MRARPRSIARHRVLALGLQLVHLSWFATTLDSGFDAVALTVSGIATAVLYAAFQVAEYRWNGYRLTPILFYLAAGIFRLGAGVLFVVVAARDDYWHLMAVGVYDVSGYLMHGHWLALLGDWCFLAGYVLVTSLAGRDSPAPAVVAPALWARVSRAGLLTALAAFLLRFAARRIGFGGFDLLTDYVQFYGVAAGVYLMLLAARNSGGNRSVLPAGVAYALLALDCADAFFSYSKSPLLVAVLPLVLIGGDLTHAGSGPARMTRLARPAAVTLLVAYFFLFVVSTYSPLRRAAFQDFGFPVEPTDQYAVPVTPILADAVLGAIPGTEQFEEAHRFPDGVWHLIRRMSMTPMPAWAYQQVEVTGVRGDSFVEHLLTNVTPRIVWPDKPLLSPGHDFAVTIGEARSSESAYSAIALTLQGAWYWWAGYAGLILGCALTGFGFAASWLLFRNQLTLNPASAIVGLMLCHEGFRWFESAFLGALPMYVYLLVVFAPLQFVLRRIVGYRAAVRLPAGPTPAWQR